MQSNNFSLPEYLARIHFTGNAEPTAACLNRMMQCQLQSIPFENLDVQAGKIVSLAPEEIVEKIIHHPRGGYCYEVNGLFAMALETLGVPYQFVAARPMFYPARRPKTHMAIVATLEGRQYLCDLGFGSYGIRHPICLDALDTDIAQDCDTFRLSRNRTGDYLLQAYVNGNWANQYEFNLSAQEWVDFVPANYLNSTHPDAIFVQKLVLILHTPHGRRSLVGDVLKEIANGVTQERIVPPSDIPEVLSDLFGLQQ